MINNCVDHDPFYEYQITGKSTFLHLQIKLTYNDDNDGHYTYSLNVQGRG